MPAEDAGVRIQEGDHLCFYTKGAIPSPEELEPLIFSRQPSEITGRLKKACVGIAGAGGLGTVVAEILARSGLGKLVIADYDIVEPSNLNRQRFFISQLGMPKVHALADTIKKFNPFVEVVPVNERVTAESCSRIFSGCSIVAECFDSPANKADIIFGLRKNLPGCIAVAASGIAGIQSGDEIKTIKISDNFYVIGDMESDAAAGTGLFASRVGIAACLQAHCIIRLIAGAEL